MTQRTFVVDSNYLRSPELSQLVADRHEHRFVVPDLVMFEAAKSTNRELTLRSSLKTLSGITGRVFIGRSVSELLRAEIHEQEPLQTLCVNYEATAVFRRILDAVRDNVTNDVLQEVIDDPSEYLPSLMRDHLSHAENKAHTIALQTEAIEPEFTAEFLQRLRRDEVGNSELMIVTFDRAVKLTFEVLHREYKFSVDNTLRMINAKCVLLRYFFVRYWMALQNSIRANFINRSAAQVSNDNIDAHNVIIATQLGKLLTKDERSYKAFVATIQLLSVPVKYGLTDIDGYKTIVIKG